MVKVATRSRLPVSACDRGSQAGFTLAELLVTLLVLAVASGVMGGLIASATSIQNVAYENKQERVNKVIGRHLVAWAEDINDGRLPEPHSDTDYTNTVYDPATTDPDVQDLVGRITQDEINIDEINDDGYASRRVRVYQRVEGLTEQVPVFGQVGPTAQLTYDYGVIYHTECPINDNTCNPSASGLPGDSVEIDDTNYTSWDTAGTDGTPARISTLPVQTRLLNRTLNRLNIVRDQARAVFNALLVSAAPGTDTNFFPAPTGASAPDLSGSDPGSNQDCHDGWYDLSSTDVNVLEQMGLSRQEYGQTTWGAPIEYCRDYSPTSSGVSDEGELPHAGALRIHREVTEALAPGNAANNLFFTF